MKEAMFYEKIGGNKVRCYLCPHRCKIFPGKRGICGVRENREGTLYTLVYQKVVSWAVDPIEKKPLYHFYPGEDAFSIATVGCNFHCLHCQNYSISQFSKEREDIPGEDISPEEIIRLAKQKKTKIIAYTYTEPTIFFEYAYDTCRLAKKEGIKNVFVTNGYIEEEPLRKIAPYMDAANVDLKSIREEFYNKICGAHLNPVLKTLKLLKELGIWVEVTTLIIPTLNDSKGEQKEIANFIATLGKETPWHISRFYPAYRLTNLPPTPAETLHQARRIGLEAGLKYVYVGNLPKNEGENTYCPNCGKIIINRSGYWIGKIKIKQGKCGYCSFPIEGVWKFK